MSYMDHVYADRQEMAQEARYRVEWLDKHKGADETVFTPDGIPVSVTYRYPWLDYHRDNQEFWNALAAAQAKEEAK